MIHGHTKNLVDVLDEILGSSDWQSGTSSLTKEKILQIIGNDILRRTDAQNIINAAVARSKQEMPANSVQPAPEPAQQPLTKEQIIALVSDVFVRKEDQSYSQKSVAVTVDGNNYEFTSDQIDIVSNSSRIAMIYLSEGGLAGGEVHWHLPEGVKPTDENKFYFTDISGKKVYLDANQVMNIDKAIIYALSQT